MSTQCDLLKSLANVLRYHSRLLPASTFMNALSFTANIAMGDGFSAKSQAFIDWFVSQPGATLDPRVSLTDFRARGAGRGLSEFACFTFLTNSTVSTRHYSNDNDLTRISCP